MFLDGDVLQVVVQAETVALTLEVDDTRVVTTCTVRWSHHITSELPRSQRVVAHRITETFRTACSSEVEIILTVTLIEPRTLLIVLRHIVQTHRIALQRNHILVQQGTIQMRITPVHISLPIIVDKHRWVDILPVLTLPYQRFPDWVFERSVWRVRYQHTDAVSVNRAVHIPLTVTFNHTFSPCTVLPVIPLEVVQRSHRSVVGPVHHICRGIEQPIKHLEALRVIFVVCGIEINGITMHIRCRVSRILG